MKTLCQITKGFHQTKEALYQKTRGTYQKGEGFHKYIEALYQITRGIYEYDKGI